MRQGDREGTPEFKSRYDNQVKANEGVGVVNDDDSLVAVDFLSKLDQKRFTSLLTALRNNAAIGASSYPTTLTGAYMDNRWIDPIQGESHGLRHR
jgi:hypothetical protein